MRALHTEKEMAFLEANYPMVKSNNRIVGYNPQLHEMKVGEAVFYRDGESLEQNIKRGVIEQVHHVWPWKYALYYIRGGRKEGYSCCLVWPDVQHQQEGLYLTA